MISIEAVVHSKFIEKFGKGVLSAKCERMMIDSINIKKSDVPEESLKLKCSICSAIVDSGFYCELTKRVACESCERAEVKTDCGKQTKYPCVRTNHSHLKIPGLNGEHLEIVSRINKS